MRLLARDDPAPPTCGVVSGWRLSTHKWGELRDLSFEDLQAAGRSTMLNVISADWESVKPLLTSSRGETP